MSQIAVFCGSQTGSSTIYANETRLLGEEMARRGHGLVYGGGCIGLMGVIANSVLGGGGTVVGVIPRSLFRREVAFEGATELIVVESMHERKALMADRAEAFIALPGGYGTCDELFEILTWAQLGIHCKPVGMLNINGFFDPLLGWLDRMVADGFLKSKYRDLLMVAPSATDLLSRIEQFRPVKLTEKWITEEQR